MLDLETLTAINIEQLVTRTDLLLLRGRVHGARSRRSLDFSSAAAAALAISQARRSAHDDATKTIFVRDPQRSPLPRIAHVARLVLRASTRDRAVRPRLAPPPPVLQARFAPMSPPPQARNASILSPVGLRFAHGSLPVVQTTGRAPMSPMTRAGLVAALVTWLAATALCLLA